MTRKTSSPASGGARAAAQQRAVRCDAAGNGHARHASARGDPRAARRDSAHHAAASCGCSSRRRQGASGSSKRRRQEAAARSRRRGGSGSRGRMARAATRRGEKSSRRDLGLRCTKVIVVCTNLKYWKVGKKFFCRRWIGLTR